MFRQLRKDSRNIIKSVIQLVYFMRGGVQYNDVMLMSPVEREMVNDFITERLEQEGKKPHPNY